MTGTEIMIDGVDVSLCELLTKDNYCSDDAPCNVVVCVYKFNKIKDKLTETLDENRVLEDRLDYIAEILEPYENEFEKEIKYLPEAIKTILKRQKEESEKFYNDGQTEITKLCGRLQQKDKEIDELKQKYLELKEQNGSYIVQLNTVKEQLEQLKAQNMRSKFYV